MYPPPPPHCLGGGGSLFAFGMHYFMSIPVFAIILTWKRELVALLMSCYCKCSVALPHGAMHRSAVCDCGIS